VTQAGKSMSSIVRIFQPEIVSLFNSHRVGDRSFDLYDLHRYDIRKCKKLMMFP
jgi:hypothetical protein